MRLTPKDVHRKPVQRDEGRYSDNVPTWYEVWLGQPGGSESVLLGRTERLPRPRWWRVYPASGEFPKPMRGWTNAIEFLLEVREAQDEVVLPRLFGVMAHSEKAEKHRGPRLVRCQMLA